jgi:HK97 family phage major capsid protein
MKDLHEEFAKLKSEVIDAVNKAKAEDRNLSPDEQQEQERRFARCDAIKSLLTQEKRATDLSIEQFQATQVAARQTATATPPPARGMDRVEVPARQRYHGKDGKAAVNQWIRTGQMRDEFAAFALAGMRDEFAIASTAAAPSSGTGALIPVDVAAPIVIKRLPNSFIAALASRGQPPLYTPGTEPISQPVFDDSANFAVGFSETIATPDASPPELEPGLSGSVMLNAYPFRSKAMWLTNTLLYAVDYDILGYVEPILQKRIDKYQEATWTAKIVNTPGVTTVTTQHAAGISYSDLLAWQTAIPNAYWADQVFLISPTLFTAARALVDTLGRPMYQESLAVDAPDTLFGRPVFVNDALAAYAANNVSGITMSASGAVARICRNQRLARYVNLPQYPDMFGTEIFGNADFAFVGPAVAVLKAAAS